MIWLADAIIFGGLSLFVFGRVKTFVIALRGRDDPNGKGAFRWLGMATFWLLIPLFTAVIAAIHHGGLRH